MNTTHTTDAERQALVERYLVGRLDGPELDAFERHLIACADCQSSVRLAVAVRADLPATPTAASRGAWRPIALLGLAAAAAIVVVDTMRARERDRYRELGRVAALAAYRGIAVRGAAHSPEALFDEGMRHYEARRLDSALAMLRQARASGADSLPTSFFIGVTELGLDRPRVALGELAFVVRPDRRDTPYRAEAEYYLAKAWLQLAEPDSADTHLRLSATPAARSLSDSLARARR